MYTIGINDTHNSSIAIFKNNKIIFAAEEERFSRCKQISGFPFYALRYAIKEFQIKNNQINDVAFATKKITGMNIWNTAADFSLIEWYKLQNEFFFPQIYKKKKIKLRSIFRNYKPSKSVHYPLTKIPFKASNEMKEIDYEKINNIRATFAAKFLNISKKKIDFFDHHTCSAYYGYFINCKNFRKKTLVVTCDSGGDSVYNSIRIFDKKKIINVKQNSISLVGQIYDSVTLMLGMNPSRHQYKLMGLAPYATEYHRSGPKKFLLNLFKVKGLNFIKNKKMKDYFFYIKNGFKFNRFDGIAAGTQDFVESILSKWFNNMYKKFKINNFVFVGGVANNVKANKTLIDQKFVKNLFVPPGPGDESLSIGAIFASFIKNNGYLKTKKIFNYNVHNAFWGNSINKNDLEQFKKNKIIKKYYTSKYDNNFKITSKILAKKKIVLMCFGKMEFGNRALGHRSILCNPSDRKLVDEINLRFKKRDFWMPFAPSILFENQNIYIKNKKKIESKFMTLSFDSCRKAITDLICAIHPYDQTLRPQLVKKTDCPRYYQLLKEFKKITGIGGVLNTSLNVHDKPIICKPKDIIKEFLISDEAIKNIEHIYIENTLFSLKKNYVRV